MKFLAYILVCVFIVFVFYGLISFVRFAYVRIKGFMIRRKLSKIDTSVKKND
jgi:hypothetical protein